MNEMTFSELNLLPEMQRAIDELGFEQTTDIQAEAIPLLRTGADVIGRSQTGTGKTIAFSIPAIERIDRSEETPTPQVLILCPTRELAQQGCEEIKKLTRFMLGIWPVDVYGGAAMDRQIMRLRRCNLVIGTPGRIMDHMRRGTINLENIKMVVLDEADEMLSMGFREDIETILKDVPEDRQTVLFSATMPDAILELTEQFQKEPRMIAVNQEQVTLDQIKQLYMEVPMGRKLDALILLLHAYAPQRCMIFCNTKLMCDEVATHLNKNGFTCEAIHGDMNQSQRTRVMEGFKSARLPILVATDVAARGIDVNDVDYVINYDIPQNSEYYVHRIGRTGRAGKEGCAISISSGRRQFFQIKDLAKITKSEITAISIPTVAEIRERMDRTNLEKVQNAILGVVTDRHMKMVVELMDRGYDLTMVAAAAFDLAFARDDSALQDIIVERKVAANGMYRKMVINIGRRHKVAPNHIVSAIAERANIRGSAIGKIEIYDDKTIVGVPASIAEEIVHAMDGTKICGNPTMSHLTAEKPESSPKPGEKRRTAPGDARSSDRRRGEKNFSRDDGHRERNAHRRDESPESAEQTPVRRGKNKISPETKARLLDGDNLGQFEIGKKDKRSARNDYHDRHDSRPKRSRDDRRDDRRNDRRHQRKHHG